MSRAFRTSIVLAVLAVPPAPIAARQSAEAAIETARLGGVTIACRHGITNHSRDDAEVVRYDDLTTQRLLSAEGEAQSRQMGDAFRQLGIPVHDVVASPMHRAWFMGELMFGRVRIDSIWYTADGNYGGSRRDARARVLAETTGDSVRVIISHLSTLLSVLPSARGQLEEGSCAVVRPGGGAIDVVGIVPWQAWLSAAGRSGGETQAPRPATSRERAAGRAGR